MTVTLAIDSTLTHRAPTLARHIDSSLGCHKRTQKTEALTNLKNGTVCRYSHMFFRACVFPGERIISQLYAHL